MTRGCVRGEWGLGQVGPSPCFSQLPLALSGLVLGSFKSCSRGRESNSKVCDPRRRKNRY